MKKTLFIFFCIFSSGLLMAQTQFTIDGNNLYSLADRVGIGTKTPTEKSEVKGNLLINTSESDGGRVIWRGGVGGTQEYRARVFIDGHLGFFPGEGNPTALSLTQSGNVGIGIFSPTERLEVRGSLLINTSESEGGRVIWRGGTNGTQEYRARIGADGHFAFFPGEGKPVALSLTQSGNVGVGVLNSPTERLEVRGSLLINTESSEGGRVIWRGGTNGTQEYRARIGTDGHFAFFPGEGKPVALALNQNGSVGIGTIATSNYKLAVEGKIVAREVKVTLENPWADYVFSEQYKLIDLKELEAYIKKNNHLPGISSANEVEENEGVDLGEMNRKLLEKIEELTLYIIDLKKENNQIKETVEEMKQRLK